MKMPLRFMLITLALLVPACAFSIESTAPAANSEPTYLQLRHVQVSGEAYSVENLKIVRDAGMFELNSGIMCLLNPVHGMVTGAVFHGVGMFSLRSNDPREQNQMKMLTGGPGISEEFDKLVMRFADGTPEELQKVLVKKSGSVCPNELDDNQKYLRTELGYNLTGRLLQPVLAGRPDGLFLAFFNGKKFGRLGFAVDPQGARFGAVHPEEVAFASFNDSKSGIWYSGHLLTEPDEGWKVKQPSHESGAIKAVHHKIDATIEKSGFLSATDTGTFVAQVDGLRVVPFTLFRKLRVSKVSDGSGVALNWIQEKQDEDAQYFAILDKPAKKGDQFVVVTSYAGKDTVFREGDGNYYPAARESWYPNTHVGDYADYEITLRTPKNLTMAATGTLKSQHNEGNQSVTEWKSDTPLSVAGFNFGDFKMETAKLEKQGVQVTAFANKEIPDIFKQIQQAVESPMSLSGSHSEGAALGTMNTTPLLKKALAEAELSVQLYSDYFGPMSYKSVQVTQQTATNYGQAWPGLVFLPILYFLDDTQRHQLGRDSARSQYWKVVEPHEVAHEWWGHSIGWASYRDQWMSEGFADFSASLYVQYIRGDRKEYLLFWKDKHDQMVEKDEFGHRPIDVGSVTMGYRVSTGKVGGWTGQHVLYPKGAFILQMIRMMMFSMKTGDADFKAMMHDLVNTYRNKAVSTEDFKAMVEKHMTPAMDADRNGKMDWFFDEYVYGTELPSYSMETSTETSSDGKNTLTLKVTQSGVSQNFKMVVPIYFETAEGKVGRLGQMLLIGNQTSTQKVPFGAMAVPKRFMLNYNYDVLSLN